MRSVFTTKPAKTPGHSQYKADPCASLQQHLCEASSAFSSLLFVFQVNERQQGPPTSQQMPALEKIQKIAPGILMAVPPSMSRIKLFLNTMLATQCTSVIPEHRASS